MQAIFDAFDRHERPCGAPEVVTGGCATDPAAAPAVTATPRGRDVELGWDANLGAGVYNVYRTEVVFACDVRDHDQCVPRRRTMKVLARLFWICLSASLLLVSVEAAPEVTCSPPPSDTKLGDGCPETTTVSPTGTDLVSTSADLELRMSAPDMIVKPGPLTYDLAVTNQGPGAAQNVRVTTNLTFVSDSDSSYSEVPTDFVFINSLPSGTSPVGTCGCNNDPCGFPLCILGGVESGDCIDYVFQIDVPRPGTVTNVSTVSSDTEDPFPDNNSASATTIILPSEAPPPPPPPPPPPLCPPKGALTSCSEICITAIFADDFESGDTSAWSNTVP